MLQQNQMVGFQGLPEIVRVKALRGFRGLIEGVQGEANPGDVVDVPRELAIGLRYGNKAVMVDPEKVAKKRQENYLPARKKDKPLDPQAKQIAALVEAVAAMKEAVTVQSQALEQQGKVLEKLAARPAAEKTAGDKPATGAR